MQRQPEYSSLSIILEKYTLAVNARINSEIKDERQRDSATKLYEWGTHLELYGRCTYPEECCDELYHFSIYSSPNQEYEFSKTLKDCHVMEKWEKVYRTVKGTVEPVYNIPDGLPGFIQLQRRPKLWQCYLFLLPQTVTNMITLLSHHRPNYIDLHCLHRERRYYIVGFTLQTSNPDEE